MPLPVSAIWDETRAFVQREAKLLVPVALATLAIGSAGTELASDMSRTTGGMSAGILVILLMSLLLVALGQLAILAMVLKPGISVGESLSRGLSRLLKVIGFGILSLLVVMLVFGPLLFILQRAGYDPMANPPQLPAWATFYTFFALGALAWLGVRFYTFTALIMDREIGMADAMRQSFAQTRGHALVLLGVIMLFLLVGQLTQLAAGSITGILFGFLAKAAGQVLAGKVMVALAVGMVAAALGVIATVFSAFAYRYLSGTGNA
jgi:hypothetical protein